MLTSSLTIVWGVSFFPIMQGSAIGPAGCSLWYSWYVVPLVCSSLIFNFSSPSAQEVAVRLRQLACQRIRPKTLRRRCGTSTRPPRA
ncbi:hypothetical protein BC828DRAFT_296105 [Blastocladiella britannica]|nr:hypothetical protein BC828DRAFT_296105 [Blastocladiella britannica]